MKMYMHALHIVLGIIFVARGFWILENQLVLFYNVAMGNETEYCRASSYG